MVFPPVPAAWEYDPGLFSAEAFLIVIKTGNMPGFAVWLFDGTAAASWSGLWNSAWKNNAPGECCSDISHFGIYATGAVVPEPGTLVLFGIGLIGTGFARRKAVR